jgi:hypothetical protein
MTEHTKAPEADFEIYAAQPEGFTYVVPSDTNGTNPFGARPGRVEFGESLTVTRALRDANRDRLGVSWLEHDEAAQLAEYGKLRFGFGEVPERIRAQVRAARRAEIEEQRRKVLANSHAAGRYAAERSFVAALDAELAALDVEAQG